MNNFKKVVTMVLAFAMVLTCVMVTPAQAAGKLNKATASIYAGETVQLKAKVKSVTWGSSNKKVAKVSKTGLVTGVKKGTCTITAKDNKTKTAYKCKVTVKAAKNFGFKAKDIFVYTGGNVISYPGKEIKGATYVLDGKKLTKKNYCLPGQIKMGMDMLLQELHLQRNLQMESIHLQSRRRDIKPLQRHLNLKL